MLAIGQATVTNTTIDIGPILNLFDGSVDSLIRTPDIDPAVITLTFAQAQTFYGFSAYFSYASGDPAIRWQVETADTQADLDNHTGSWRQALPLTGTAPDRFCRVVLPSPVTARVARLTATKLYGDDYVHINEWQLLGAPLNDLTPPSATGSSPSVLAPGATAHFITVNYADASGINVASLDSRDLLVTGPNGFETNAVFYGVDSYLNGQARLATYWFIPPNGRWDSAANGAYTIILQPNEVADIAGNTRAVAQVLGSFIVSITPPARRPECDLAENNAALWQAGADGASAATTNDSTRKTLGASSIRFTTDGGFDTWLRFPPAGYADWDLTRATSFNFSLFAENTNGSFQDFWVRLNGTEGGYFEYHCPDDLVVNHALGSWKSFSIPLAGGKTDYTWVRTTSGSPSLQHIESVEFHADTWGYGFSLWYDRVGFNLPVLLLTANSRLGTNGFGFSIPDFLAQSSIIEASTNLSHWLPVRTNLPGSTGAVFFTDPEAGKLTRRFYRLRLN